jgi:hypothetical protein
VAPRALRSSLIAVFVHAKRVPAASPLLLRVELGRAHSKFRASSV